jgi:drug/metabolite transporter (DMT)-like permease
VLVVVTRGDPARALAELISGGELLGDALIFLGGVSWVIYTLCAPAFRGWSPLRFTVLTCIPGAVGLVVAHAIAIAVGAAVLPGWGQITAVGWQIVYLSVGTVVLGVLGFNAAVKRLGPLNTMLVLNLVPIGVFAIEAALGRSFAAVEIGGALLVIAALAANNLYLRGVSTRR